MLAFDLEVEKVFDPKVHVEKILGQESGGDVTVACWEPGQVSPNHCHPNCTEIYFCYQGGGVMRLPDGSSLDIKPGSFCVHPPGEVHEYENGKDRSLLFRIRYGADEVETRIIGWPTNLDFEQSEEDIKYFKENPV